MADDPGFVSCVTLVESVRGLESRYEVGAARIGIMLETLLRLELMRVERAEVVWCALRRFRSGSGDFPDRLVAELAAAARCHTVYTFDRSAAKHAGMTLLA